MSKRWRLLPFVLVFLGFAVSGFVVCRSIEPAPPASGGAPCAAQHELAHVVDELADRVEAELSGGGARDETDAHAALALEARGPSEVTKAWRLVSDWVRRFAEISAVVRTLGHDPGKRALAELQRALGSQLEVCASAEQGREAIETALRRAAPRQVLSSEGVALLGAAGCASVVDAALDHILLQDARVARAGQVARGLASLSEPAGPGRRLEQLSGLRNDLAAPGSPLSSGLVGGFDGDFGASELLRLKGELGERAPRGCLPDSPAHVQQLLAERFDRALTATGLFSRSELGWQASPELGRIAAVLEAFFELEFVKRRAPKRCVLGAEPAYQWDDRALRRVSAVLLDYRRGGQLDRLSATVHSRDDASFPAFWAALPDAACGKITLNLCVEIHDARRALPRDELSPLASARLQAASLESTRATWLQIAEHTRSFGCSPASFGLDESARVARQLLKTAQETLDQSAVEWLTRMSEAINSASADPLSSEQVEAELRRLRLEVSALAFGVIEPARDQLRLVGAASSSPAHEAQQPRSAATEPSLRAWEALLDDLELTVATTPGGPSASDGQSGLFAYERFQARLLSQLPRPCNVPLDAWQEGVFDDSDNLFHRYGRDASAALQSLCGQKITDAGR